MKTTQEKKKPNLIQIVKLNIGNVKYVTTYETLSCAGENYLTALFESKRIPGKLKQNLN